MVRRILLATDGSDDARKATQWVRELPIAVDGTVRVLSVAVIPHSALDIAPVREFQDAIRAECRHAAETARTTLAPRGAVETRVVDGEPRDAIVREAREWPAELTVVGARGLGAVGRFLLGSVSTAVLHGAPGTVAVVRGEARRPRRVVVACDGSPDAVEAVRFVAGLSLGPDVTVRFVGVVAVPPIVSAGPEMAMPWPPTLDRFIEEQKAALDDALAWAESEVRGSVGRVERVVVVGQPAAEILAAVEQTAADLVVVGARGLGVFGRLVLGSVSDRLVHHAPCPVLVVKGKA
jgi:nucleotide-binding universal stress UspA family protein